MAIFNSYVKLPEGKSCYILIVFFPRISCSQVQSRLNPQLNHPSIRINSPILFCLIIHLIVIIFNLMVNDMQRIILFVAGSYIQVDC